MNAFVILILILGVTGYVTYPLWGNHDTTRKRRPLAAAAATSDFDADELDLDRAAGRLAGEELASLRSIVQTASSGEEADEIERRVRTLREKRGGTRAARSPAKRNRG